MTHRDRGLRIALFLALSLPACAWSGDRAHEAYLTEVGRGLAPDARTDEGARRAGAALEADRDALAHRKVWTLRDCFRLALANADDLRAQGERIFQSDTGWTQAFASILPRVALNARYTQDSNKVVLSGRAFSPQKRNEYWFSIQQTLLDPRLLPSLDLAAATRRIEALKLQDARARLLFQVASSFYEVLSGEADLVALQAADRRAREHVRVLGEQRRAGLAEAFDIELAEARQAEVEAQRIQAEHDVQRARLQLGRWVGIPPANRPLEDTLDVAPPQSTVPRLVDRALGQRLDLAMGRAAIDEARASRNIAASGYLPEVTADLEHWTHMRGGFNENVDWTLAVNLTWPLFDGGAREAEIARAQSQLREQALRLRALEKDVRQDVQDALLAYRSFDRALQALEVRARASASAEFRIKRRARAGAATILDSLTAQSTRQAAERDLARARLARKLALLRIRLALGDLHETLTPEPAS